MAGGFRGTTPGVTQGWTPPGAGVPLGLGMGAAAAAVGLFLGLVAYVAASGNTQAAGLLAVAAAAPFVAMAVGDVRRALLGLLILDVPFQWDINLGYQTAPADLGALGGFNLSLTTFALAGLYALWTAEWLTDRPEVARPNFRAALPLIVYVGLNIASIAVAENATLAGYEVALLVQTLLLFIYVVANVRTRRDVQFVATMLLAALLLESLVIIAVQVTGIGFDALGLSTESDWSDSATSDRAGGTFGSPNTAGSFVALLLPAAAAVSASPFPPATRRLAFAALGAGLPALIFTFSRGAWLSVAVAFLVFWLVAWRGGLVSRRVLVAALVGALLVAAPLYGAVGARLTEDDSGAAEARIPLIELSLDVIEDHPLLGVGVNNFYTAIPEYAGPEFRSSWLYTVHNKYALVAAEAGILALAAFLLFLVSIIRRGARAWRARDRLLSPLALGLTAGLVGQTAHMFVDIFQNRPQVQTLWLTAAFITALAALAVSAQARGGERRPPGGR